MNLFQPAIDTALIDVAALARLPCLPHADLACIVETAGAGRKSDGIGDEKPMIPLNVVRGRVPASKNGKAVRHRPVSHCRQQGSTLVDLSSFHTR